MVRRESVTGRRRALMDDTDLLRRQKQTWAKIPTKLQDLIIKQVRESLEDLITNKRGAEDESTVGFEDDHEVLEAELRAREAARKERGPAANALGVGTDVIRVATDVPGQAADAAGVTSDTGVVAAGSLAVAEDTARVEDTVRVASGSEIAEGDLPESQEKWFVAQEGEADAGRLEEDAEGVTGSQGEAKED